MYVSLYYIVLTINIINNVHDVYSTSIKNDDKGFQQVLKYLQKYGYLEDEEGRDLDQSAISTIFEEDALFTNGITKLKEFFNLPLNTGSNIDENILELIKKDRCGMPDISREFNIRSKWHNVKHLKWHWYYHKKVNKLILDVTRRAFKIWEKHANITFSESTTGYNILISFGSDQHLNHLSATKCGYSFDKKGGVLAHAYFPSKFDIVKEIHIDEDENWSFDLENVPQDATSLLAVLTHEIGHVLGLDHSSQENSIMNPFYSYSNDGNLSDYDLNEDDILGIQSLYGKREEKITKNLNIETTPMHASTSLYPTGSTATSKLPPIIHATETVNPKIEIMIAILLEILN